ncbi:MAG: DUF5703 domain-containing protein [Marinoscillum sp.]
MTSAKSSFLILSISSLGKMKCLFIVVFILLNNDGQTQVLSLKDYNPTWMSQSINSSESMPLGGGDIGLNVWMENDEVLFYISRSGTFDENNALLKLGRVRLNLSPNPFQNGDFSQALNLEEGNVLITGKNANGSAEIELWVEVFRPVIHLEMKTSSPTTLKASYESWRYKDRISNGSANNANSYKWRGKNVVTKKDQIDFEGGGVLFYHQNEGQTMFDITVDQQKMTTVKDQMYDPLKHLTFGGIMSGKNMSQGSVYNGVYMDTDYEGYTLASDKLSKTHQLNITLHTEQTTDIGKWKDHLKAIDPLPSKKLKDATTDWWKSYWNKSHIFIERSTQDSVWQVGRNYQLFRYMLGCNAFGCSPTKFNGGLFTYDPSAVDSSYTFTPDHRNWGGGTHTAQNQRLVYFPMLKSGDFDLMIPQFEFYLKALKNAELRSHIYWNHEGACFTEQLENFGLPNYAEYSSKRPEGYDPGMQYNAWLEYQWDTVFEFCLMILETEHYADKDISKYIPLIESSLLFFDEHYQYLAGQRGRKKLDANGDLVLYPGSSCETYKMAYNATSTVVALQGVLEKFLASRYLPEDNRTTWEEMLDRIPPLTFQEFDGKQTVAPAKLWERINNTEAPQLYPVYPWGMYGIGKPDLDIAINTYELDPDVQKFKSHVGWKQYNIWAARLGLTEEAAKYTTLKLQDSGRRFPVFWGPGFDWVPDHNWGGSGAIGLQEMLLQTHGDSILLFPAWPKDWDVNFKLHAPKNTIIEAEVKNGKSKIIKVVPAGREKDIVNLYSSK